MGPKVKLEPGKKHGNARPDEEDSTTNEVKGQIFGPIVGESLFIEVAGETLRDFDGTLTAKDYRLQTVADKFNQRVEDTINQLKQQLSKAKTPLEKNEINARLGDLARLPKSGITAAHAYNKMNNLIKKVSTTQAEPFGSPRHFSMCYIKYFCITMLNICSLWPLQRNVLQM